MTDAQTTQETAPQLQKGPFIHTLRLYLVGGQQFTLNEVSDSPEVPRNVVAFINAWREKKDVWHSPNNDPRFGVRVKDVSLYEYHIGQPKNPEELNKNEAEAEVATEAEKPAEEA